MKYENLRYVIRMIDFMGKKTEVVSLDFKQPDLDLLTFTPSYPEWHRKILYNIVEEHAKLRERPQYEIVRIVTTSRTIQEESEKVLEALYVVNANDPSN